MEKPKSLPPVYRAGHSDKWCERLGWPRVEICKGGEGDGLEHEADRWAEEVLVGRQRFAEFKATKPRSEQDVTGFAKEVGIHPGIVVGMLQHHKIIPFKNLNRLKVLFEWVN